MGMYQGSYTSSYRNLKISLNISLYMGVYKGSCMGLKCRARNVKFVKHEFCFKVDIGTGSYGGTSAA